MTTTALHPRLVVVDPDVAIDFYQRAIGARLHARHVMDDIVVHAELHVDDAVFSLAAEVPEWGLLAPQTIGGSASLITLDVDDARDAGDAMVAAGATVVIPIEDRPYGRCEGRIADPFGHLWIPTHELARSEDPAPVVRRIVADLALADVTATARFYAELLGLEVVMDAGWVVTLASPANPALQLTLVGDDATAPTNAHVSIEVDDLQRTWQRAVRTGAPIMHPRTVEPWGVERFFVRDPSGNIVNVLSHQPPRPEA